MAEAVPFPFSICHEREQPVGVEKAHTKLFKWIESGWALQNSALGNVNFVHEIRLYE